MTIKLPTAKGVINYNTKNSSITLIFAFFCLTFFGSYAQNLEKQSKKAAPIHFQDYGVRNANINILNNVTATDAFSTIEDTTQAEALDSLTNKNSDESNEQSLIVCDGLHCVPSFDTSVYPITNVTFASINNTTPNTAGGINDREGFCSTANVEQGGNYTLTMQANCAGNNRFYEKAYFDWNQNDVFGDVANEIYLLGTLYGTNGADSVTLSYPIDVPSGATVGLTRMRVMHRFNGYSTSACQTGNGYGQAEDYNVFVSTPSTYCTPGSLNDETNLYFDDVEFIGTLNDVSNFNNSYSASPQGYQDHTALTNSVQAQGEGMNVYVESNTRGRIKAWIDWNKDLVFDEVSEKVYDTNGIGALSTTFGYVIPSGQAVGDYRIRIKTYKGIHSSTGAEYYGYNYSACETFYQNGNYDEYGETEDYTFTVIESCAATIDNITEGSNCAPGTVTLGVTGSTGAVSYRWYANESDTAPLATTSTGSWTTPSISTTTDYYVTAVSATCESLVKTKITATIMAITTLTFTPSVPEVCGEDDVIELSASASNEITYLIDEDFEGSGLGSFTNNNIVDNGAAENGITMWQQRTSTFVPSEQVWFPAIASGFDANKFVMATSDVGTSNVTNNALESAILDSSNFTDLALSFDMYFSRYANSSPEDVTVQASTDSGVSWTDVKIYSTDIGYGTDFASLSLDLSTYVNETNLKVRIRYYANVWCDGVAVDNIQLYGSKPLASSFTWTSGTPIDAYLDAAATIPYTAGSIASVVYVKPTAIQLQSPTFSFTATATLSNGCTVSETISINNKTQFWTGASSTDWNDPTNWSPNSVPTANSCVIIPDNTIITGSAYDAYARNVTVRPAGNLELQSGNNLIVTEWLTVEPNGVFNIRDSASIVQIDNNANSGEVRIERNSQPMYRYDYTYWSSPITAASGYLLDDLSPDTLGDKFYSWLPTQSGGNGNWIYDNPNTTVMTPAAGYAVRAPQTFSTNESSKTVFTALYQGTPNNGPITIPIAVGTDANVGAFIGDTAVTADDDQWNLIGNPYPSAIDVISFLNEAGNSTLLDGTVYVWTHNTAPSNTFPDPFYADFGANYTTNDYASVNALGSTNTAATGGAAPTPYIASGQAFFVLGLNNGNATFDNTMRVKNENSNFFKTTDSTHTNNSPTHVEKHRLWLNLSNDHGAFSQILIGYAAGATYGWDRSLDGKCFGGNDVTFYSIVPNDKLTIQARPLPFSLSDVIPLGFKAVNQDSYRIGIDHFDTLFENQQIYLKDYDLDIVHDLKASPYLFSSDAGRFNERFEIVYTTQSLSVEHHTITEDDTLKIISSDQLTVVSENKIIYKIIVFDILGKKLMTYNDLNTNEINLEGVQKGNRGLLLQIIFSDDSTLFKKALY